MSRRGLRGDRPGARSARRWAGLIACWNGASRPRYGSLSLRIDLGHRLAIRQLSCQLVSAKGRTGHISRVRATGLARRDLAEDGLHDADARAEVPKALEELRGDALAARNEQ